MKNFSLGVAGLIFLGIAIAQFLRYHYGVDVIVGSGHHVPLNISFFGSIAAAVFAVWMFIAALIKN